MTTPPIDQCTMVRFCVVFLKVKMYRKAAIFCPMLALLNIERLNFKQYLDFDSPFLLIQSRIYSSASAHASTCHMI